MTKTEVTAIIGQFGLFDLNGSKKHKKQIYGTVNIISRTQAIIERNQGNDIVIHYKDIEGFTAVKDKRENQMVCPACLGSSSSEINGRRYHTHECKVCNGTGKLIKELVE